MGILVFLFFYYYYNCLIIAIILMFLLEVSGSAGWCKRIINKNKIKLQLLFTSPRSNIARRRGTRTKLTLFVFFVT